jgi:cobalt-zinc-cadmium efflux system protein
MALGLTLGFAALEAAGGWWAGSLALLGDAAHMVSDATALGLAALAAWIAQRPPSTRHSFGLGRLETVAALANGVFMLAVVVGIVVSAVERLLAPRPVVGGAVFLIAAMGLAVNIGVALMLSRGEQTLNTRAALLHVIGDLLGSVAALIAGAVIYFTGWTPMDSILSLMICLLILYSSLRLLRDVFHVLMEGVPHHLNLREVGQALAAVHGVESVHDLHIWVLPSGSVALSAHVVLRNLAHWQSVLERQRRLLVEEFRIDHITLQPEPGTQLLRQMPLPRHRSVH